ncbi:hypothetical protein [Aidingimonas halophila]|uniref:Uncharacterized protein n=1 Tax=Aidingimonas halophila TaxID=574349 RepID=A0A1H2XZ36_9GAMM|nr:hypothetical protein [Aidingimonas halophila]GHC29488.1 hypothetical protein GCM10008094_22090 [Aidingimonas halophila]SDW98222.1 hypothetical protein SAMN05443545_103328 [Aidingimonas halophila]
MRQFLFPRRPLARRTLLGCHLIVQLGLLVAGSAWLVPRTPWLNGSDWHTAWPALAMGGGILVLAMIGVRLLAELWLLPHHLAGLRAGFAPNAVVTRSFERRPAIHDDDMAWTSSARAVDSEDTVLGNARPASSSARQQRGEPTLDIVAGEESSTTPRHEPRL